MMHRTYGIRRERNPFRKWLWAVVSMTIFVESAATVNASIILGDEIYSPERFNTGLYDLEFESSGCGISAISSTRNVSESDPELPEAFWVGNRLPGQESAPISSDMSGHSSSGGSNKGGHQGFGVLPDSALTLLGPVRLSWLAIEKALEVPLAPRFALLRPPQRFTFLVG